MTVTKSSIWAALTSTLSPEVADELALREAQAPEIWIVRLTSWIENHRSGECQGEWPDLKKPAPKGEEPTR